MLRKLGDSKLLRKIAAYKWRILRGCVFAFPFLTAGILFGILAPWEFVLNVLLVCGLGITIIAVLRGYLSLVEWLGWKVRTERVNHSFDDL